MRHAQAQEVPGATTSGLILPSTVGPRLLNAAMPSALSARGLFAIGGPHLAGSQTKQFSRRLSVAPTVMQFFAEA